MNHKDVMLTADAIERWINAMRASGRASTETELAALLGITPWNWTLIKRRKKVNRRTALAMSALVMGLKPWE